MKWFWFIGFPGRIIEGVAEIFTREKVGVNDSMRHRSRMIGFVVILAIICSGFPAGAQSVTSPERSIEWLTNPELFDEAGIVEFARHNADALQLPGGKEPVDLEKYQILKQEAGFFAKFINDQATDDIYQNVSGKMYVRMPRYVDADLKESLLQSMMKTYIKVTRQWENMGLKAPRGFIFVWIISNIDKMRQEFAIDRNIMAFALPCRYMVVPYEVISDNMKYDMETRALLDNSNPHEMRNSIAKFLQKSFATNFTHELTHVLTFSEMGFQRINDLDKWFYEGTAIWISRDNGVGLSNEYKDYKKTFDFIRMKYGNQRFQQFVRDGIQKSVPSSLRKNLRLPHYGGLARETKLWYTGMQWMEIVLSILAVLCFVLAVGRWIRTQPAGLCYLNMLLMGALYGWIYGFYNLWTNSIVGSMILNLLAVMAILFLILLNIRHLYYSFRLSREIKMAAASLSLAAEAAVHYPVEYENYQNMLELARLNQMRWKPRDGIGWAKDAAKAARAISKAAEIDGIKGLKH
jgi:hypothetical protein